MEKKFIIVLGMIVLTGCATASKQSGSSAQMQMRIGELERQLEAQNSELKELQYQMKDLTYDVGRNKNIAPSRDVSSSRSSGGDDSIVKTSSTGVIRINVSAEDVQRALKNAGYYTGPIDNKIGSGTKKAIEQFQKDKGLKADGIIGKQTWLELRSHLD